jgi:hypothetical protein
MQEILAGSTPQAAVQAAHDRTVKMFEQSGIKQ